MTSLVLAQQQATVARQRQRLVYDPTVPIAVQNEAWSCSIYAGDWVLRSLGLPSDDETLEDEMLQRGIVTKEHGLMDARGYGLAAVVRDHLPPETQVDVYETLTWDQLFDLAGSGPMAIGGRAWNHWVAVRGVSKNTIALANSAPGYKSVFQNLRALDFKRLGPFSGVHVVVE
jgi:hypothetical protein